MQMSLPKQNKPQGKQIPHPKSTKFHDDDESGQEFPTPPAKRSRLSDDGVSKTFKPSSPRTAVGPSSDKAKNFKLIDSDDEGCLANDDDSTVITGTQLETALPPVLDDEEAVETYEAYKAGQTLNLEQSIDREEDTAASRLEKRSWIRGRSSIYVDAFNLALDTVLDEEPHLFDEAELVLFRDWRGLSYEAQYLYVRLFLRKTSAWHRIGRLQYYSDIADMPGAVAELQQERELPESTAEEVTNPGELDPSEGIVLGRNFTFAECSTDHITTLDEASSLLLLDEVKVLAREAKVKGKNKKELLTNLRRTSGRQTGLGFPQLGRSETEDSIQSGVSENSPSQFEDDNDNESTSGHSTPTPRGINCDSHFTRKILSQTGECIRLSLNALKLFERVHLVFYRSTEWTEKSLTTLILAKISRRNFPSYFVSRSTTIFESRSFLLEFEASLRTQFKVDSIVEFSGNRGRKWDHEVKAIAEAVYPRWRALLEHEQRKENSIYDSGEGAYLRRFSPAWVYTRIVHKGLVPLARFKEHKREHEILSELLEQKLFHAARRGAWYTRKALLEEHYMYAIMPDESRSMDANKKYWKRMALKTCETGLQDPECHVIYHYDLQKRIRKIEKQLKIPMREQHDFGATRLAKAIDREITGIRIVRDELSGSKTSLSRKNSMNGTPPPNHRRSSNPLIPMDGPGSKTFWLDTLDTSSIVSVESLSLSHYRQLHGWKGYHVESGLLRTLFGLLFYDVLFHTYVPNVFQTPYQTCPLDLHTDAFYPSRRRDIEERLSEIEAGEAQTILSQAWDSGFERRECVIGVKWDDFDRADLDEILRCWEPRSLAVVLRVMAQEYAARGGGVPDLFLWKPNGWCAGCERLKAAEGLAGGEESIKKEEIVEGESEVAIKPERNHKRNGESRGRRSQSNGDRKRQSSILSRDSKTDHNYDSDNETDTTENEPHTTLPHGQKIYHTRTCPLHPSNSNSEFRSSNNSSPLDKDVSRSKGKVMFVEVKSENDRLSDTQRLWISVLLGAGIKVELCKVLVGEVRRWEC